MGGLMRNNTEAADSLALVRQPREVRAFQNVPHGMAPTAAS